jgi:tetratricopeptide (TPR) repeat protein
MRAVLAASEKSLGEKHPGTLSFRNNLAAHLWRQRRFAEAVPLTRRTYEIERELLGPDHQSTLVSLMNLGVQLLDLGRRAEAEPLIRKAAADCERVLGTTHPTTISAQNNLATILRDQGKLLEAEALYRRVEEASVKALSEQHPKTVSTMNNRAEVLTLLGKPEAAEAVFRRVHAIMKAHYPPDHEWRFGVLEHLAGVCERQGKLAAAEETWREFYQLAAKAPRGITHPLTLRVQCEVARTLAAQKKWVDAENWYRAALSLQINAFGERHEWSQATREKLAALYLDAKKPTNAEPVFREWLKNAPQLSPPFWRVHLVTSLLGESLLAQKKYAEAEQLLIKGYEGMKNESTAIRLQCGDRIPRTLDLLIQLATETNDAEKASKWRAERSKLSPVAPTADTR